MIYLTIGYESGRFRPNLKWRNDEKDEFRLNGRQCQGLAFVGESHGPARGSPETARRSTLRRAERRAGRHRRTTRSDDDTDGKFFPRRSAEAGIADHRPWPLRREGGGAIRSSVALQRPTLGHSRAGQEAETLNPSLQKTSPDTHTSCAGRFNF